MIDLFIETLTGTAFELRVSQFETIISVKHKIQSLEGIPISQQHLIWHSVELDDEYCLHDYDIHNGATLKLVLAMRGGPINTRRVPMEDSFVEYVESTPDGELGSSEQLSGSRQFTVVVIREGDQCNIFRVVDRAEGTLTPLSESLSAASMHNLHDDEEESDGSSRERNEENARIREKISDLKNKMEYINISKKNKKIVPSAPTTGRPISSARLQSLRTNHIKSAQPLNKTPCLPPVASSRPLAESSPQTDSYIPHPPSDTAQTLYKAAKPSTSSARDESRTYSGKLLPTRTLRKRDPDKHSLFSDIAPLQTIIPEHEPQTSDHNYSQTSLRANDWSVRSGKNRNNDKSAKCASRSETKPESPTKEMSSKTPKPLATPKYYSTENRGHSETRATSRQRDFIIDGLKESLSSQRIALQSINLSKADAKKMTGILNQAAVEPTSINLGSFSPIRARRQMSLSRAADIDYQNDDSMPSRIMSGIVRTAHHTESDTATISSAKLPPVKSKKKSSKRCAVCTKKTGLATSYPCRCGNNFCAAHRYAEAHDCTYDYKTEGRKLLEQSNPVVSAPKLPKI